MTKKERKGRAFLFDKIEQESPTYFGTMAKISWQTRKTS